MNTLLSFTEIQGRLSAEIKLAVALSILSHSAGTPNIRTRCESMRDKTKMELSIEEINTVENLAKGKSLEVWAQELLK
jgi:hypothetical protein